MVIHFVACRVHVKGTNLGKQIFYIFNLILLHVIVKFTSGATSGAATQDCTYIGCYFHSNASSSTTLLRASIAVLHFYSYELLNRTLTSVKSLKSCVECYEEQTF
jgi:hypothetical protein